MFASTDAKRYIDPSPSIGFSKAFDLRIYTPFDAAIRTDGDFVIIDWKTGAKTGGAIADARRQTASYALWALDRGIRLDRIKVQPFWLHPDESWHPQAITAEEIEDVRRGIIAHDKAERKLLSETADAKGNATFHAKMESLPPKPSAACRWCPYRKVCTDGQNTFNPELVVSR